MKFKNLREKYRSKFPTSLVAAAVKIALDMGGNMTGAYKKIEAMKRGLGDDPAVKDALRLANEETVKEVETVLEKAYDSKDVYKVKQLEYSLEQMLKQVDKTMKGSGLSAPAFSNVRSGIVKGLESIKKFYKVAGKNESVNEDAEEIFEFATSMTYFDKKGATKAEKIAKGLKIYKSTKEVGKAPNFAYTVHVDGEFDKIEKWSQLI